MSKEYRARTFKSGNSIALRLPKALGIDQGVEMTVRKEGGQFIVEPYSPTPKKIDLTGIWGSCPDLKPFAREDRLFDPSPRVWDDPNWVDRGDDPS